jgi:hypothetical protein
MSSIEYSSISCGVRQLFDLHSDFENMIKEVLDYEYYDEEEFRCSQILFSDNFTLDGKPRNAVYGQQFADYIREHNLGTITESPKIKNRNTGNKIRTWIWTIPNIRKLKQHIGWKKPDEDKGYW